MATADTIKQSTLDIISKMVDAPEVTVTEEDGMFHVQIKTETEAPTVIGRHGETIRALQKILEVICFKQLGEKAAILINVNDYREKQKERLEYIASEASKKVEERKSPMYLRGFSSYERRVMHEYVAANFPELSSYSVGEGRDRRLVVDLKSNAQPSQEEVSENQEEQQEVSENPQES